MDDLLVTCSILTIFEVASGIDAFVDINSRYKMMRALAGAATFKPAATPCLKTGTKFSNL